MSVLLRTSLRMRCLQHCKGVNYALCRFESKSSLVWKYEVECGRKFQYGMGYGMEDFYYGMQMG